MYSLIDIYANIYLKVYLKHVLYMLFLLLFSHLIILFFPMTNLQVMRQLVRMLRADSDIEAP